MNPITVKQREVIEIIETNTRHKFQGKTRQDAIEFISDHIEESKIRTKNYKANRAYEEYTFFNHSPKPKPAPYVPEFYYVPDDDETKFGEESNLGGEVDNYDPDVGVTFGEQSKLGEH